jgi:CubicO group peptidase (beta-lactamase class C family)
MSSPRTWLFGGLLLLGILWLAGSVTAATDGDWSYADPATHGIDATRLELMKEAIDGLPLPIDSVIVVRHGDIVFEHFPDPLRKGPDRIHNLYSVTKSITSILIGIAIEKGFIEGVDQRVVDFFPDREIANLDERKERMTLEHLLTMTSGLEWEGPDDMFHSWGDAIMSGDPVQYVLDRPMAYEPGTEWYYNGGCSHLLSAILTETTGKSTYQFAREVLFGPLGITRVQWPRDPNGIYYGGQDIWLTPYGMAKIGQLMLDGGVWNGEQVVPADWVAELARSRAPSWWGGYGYQWWTFPDIGVFFAAGAFEQRIYVVPELDMVVVFTSSNWPPGISAGERTEGPPVVEWLFGNFILPACDDHVPSGYSDFGFSLEIPDLMDAVSQGWTESRASDVSGLVRFEFGGSPYEGAGVQWTTIEGSPDFESALDGFLAILEPSGVGIDAIGPLTATALGGRVVVYRRIDVTTEDGQLAGGVGALYCEATDRMYVLYHMARAGLSEWFDPVDEFVRFFDSFDCDDK